ncbi:MAG: hypothetical protein GY847_16910 [Proteobacteria bacterium]|nr:hypothetical protein [Pseudomonadota bacterium]
MKKKNLQLSKILFLALLVGAIIGATPFVVSYLIKRGQNTGYPIPAHHPVHRSAKIHTEGVPESKPMARENIRIYYDAVHGSRHLYDRDNRRYRTDYHTVAGWYRLHQALRTAGYDIHAEDYACFDAQSLEPYDVFIVGEQTYHARFMTGREREVLIEWVNNGGGLFITVEHTNAHYMGDVFNSIVKDMPVEARFDGICDTLTAHRSSPSWVTLEPKEPHPVTEGVHIYSFDNGCSLDTEHGILWSSKKSWSDEFDPNNRRPIHNGNKKRDDGELSGPLAGVAAFEYGKGRVVVIGDHNALSNNALYKDDHHRFAMNAIRWLAHAENRDELVNWDYPSGYDLLVHTGAGSEFEIHKKERRGRYYTFYGFLSKEPQIRPWTAKTIRSDEDVLLLGAPTKGYSNDELTVIDEALSSGKSVIWLASIRSLKSAARDQLEARYKFHVSVQGKAPLRGKAPYEVHGPNEWTHGIFRVYMQKNTPTIYVEGLDPIVQLTWGTTNIEDEQWERTDVIIDLISSKEVGPGRFYVVSPLNLFDDRGLKSIYGEGADVVRQQMAELMLRTVKIAAGDSTVYAD